MSIFDGNDKLIQDFFGLEKTERLRQKTTCRELVDKDKTVSDFEALISDLYCQIDNNRTSSRTPSKENWRSSCQTRLDPGNRSPEVLLERAIAILGEKGIMPGWCNQVPVASGLIDGRADKRAAIDLVHLEDNHATFIELKWKSDTPAFAAFEILQYGLAYLFSYIHRKDFGYAEKDLMNVNRVSLQVLAPSLYYDKCTLGWLGQGLNESIRSFASSKTNGAITMYFDFLAFPKGFELPFDTGSKVKAMTALPPGDEQVQSLVSTVISSESVW